MRSAGTPTVPDPAASFAARLARLGPFEPRPLLAIGVSGGADSTALTLLAADWARGQGGQVLGLIVDHGLRAGSAAEAALTRDRLAAGSIAARILTLQGLGHGPGLAARARAARLAALTDACRSAGILHLLLGHHAGDQAETWLMRARAGSGAAGLAGMAALRESADLRLLRPLLDVFPASLRAYLRGCGMEWVEDPSNADTRHQRARLRAELREPGCMAALVQRTLDAGSDRSRQDAAVAAVLARRVRFSPLGYAVLTPGPIQPAALAALVQTIAGRAYPVAARSICRLAAAPAPATLGGVRLLDAGRLGPGLLLVRETAPPPVPAMHGAVWDRFVLDAPHLPPGLMIAALGDARPQRRSLPPAAVLRVLPALWRDGGLVSVPLLLWPEYPPATAWFRFSPPVPACGAPWIGAGRGDA